MVRRNSRVSLTQAMGQKKNRHIGQAVRTVIGSGREVSRQRSAQRFSRNKIQYKEMHMKVQK